MAKNHIRSLSGVFGDALFVIFSDRRFGAGGLSTGRMSAGKDVVFVVAGHIHAHLAYGFTIPNTIPQSAERFSEGELRAAATANVRLHQFRGAELHLGAKGLKFLIPRTDFASHEIVPA